MSRLFLLSIFLNSLLPIVAKISSKAVNSCSVENSILFLPLDERFTTRDAFINLAASTPFCIVTPPVSMLPSLKQGCDIDALHEWVEENIPLVKAAIISSEMYLYGGLITSRTSNESTAIISSRLKKLASYGEHLTLLYISNVVMRIPAYNGDFEEPWYWADYGYDIFSYSFYTDKYNQQQNISDKETAQFYESKIPKDALSEFLWRRSRNHNITLQMTDLMRLSKSKSSHSPFQFLFITLDDNAEFGFNIREAADISAMVSLHGLSESIPIYPGADEVQMIQLSRYATRYVDRKVQLGIVYRDQSAANSIPNYEGQAMSATLSQQIAASGATWQVLESASSNAFYDALLLVNNFSGEQQLEASQQPMDGSTNDFSVFAPYIAKQQQRPVGFCDNRYSNGADASFVQFMNDQMSRDGQAGMKALTYAGWNTNGNTIGTVVANTVLLTLFRDGVNNGAFNALRILEDMHYQAALRQELVAFVSDLSDPSETASNLVPDLEFYQRYSFKRLNAHFKNITATYGLPWQLESIYYPWNRTFEIGFKLAE